MKKLLALLFFCFLSLPVYASVPPATPDQPIEDTVSYPYYLAYTNSGVTYSFSSTQPFIISEGSPGQDNLTVVSGTRRNQWNVSTSSWQYSSNITFGPGTYNIGLSQLPSDVQLVFSSHDVLLNTTSAIYFPSTASTPTPTPTPTPTVSPTAVQLVDAQFSLIEDLYVLLYVFVAVFSSSCILVFFYRILRSFL